MNRKLLVGLLLVLAVAPVGTLMATGFLSPDAGSPNQTNATTTLTATTGLAATVSTTVLPRVHQHFKIDLTISLGDCINPYGKAC